MDSKSMRSYIEGNRVVVDINGKTIIANPEDSIYIAASRMTYANGSIVNSNPCAATVVFESLQAMRIMDGITFQDIAGIDKISIGVNLKYGPIKVSKITIDLLNKSEIVFHLGLFLEEARQEKIYMYLTDIEDAIYSEVNHSVRYNYSDDLVIDLYTESNLYDIVSRIHKLLSLSSKKLHV